MTWPPHDYPDYPEYPALGYGPRVYPPSSHPPSSHPPPGYSPWVHPQPGYGPENRPPIRRRATAHLSAAGLRALPATELPAYPRLCLAVRLRQSATVRIWNTRAGDNPVAATEPHRHLQRRGLLHPDQHQGHLGADRDHRSDYADHHVDRHCRALGRREPAADRPGRRTHRGLHNRLAVKVSRARRPGRLAGRPPTLRHAHGRRKPGGGRLDNRPRRNVGQGFAGGCPR